MWGDCTGLSHRMSKYEQAMRRGWWLGLLLLFTPISWIRLQADVVSITPDADAFMRSETPTNNYGGAGAISVSGLAAVNGDNQQKGLFDSLIQFSTSNLTSSFDASLGSHDWLILGATLRLTEVGAPLSPIFNRGVGAFEIR